MYIGKVAHTDKNGKKYHTFKLIESVRTERGPRQRMLLNLGTDFAVPEEKWKDLANRIEEIVTGQSRVFPCADDIEERAVRYAREVVAYHGEEEKEPSAPDYARVDVDTIDHEHVRSVGPEHVVYETMKTLGLPDLFTSLGFNKPASEAALGVIAARLVAPSSEEGDPPVASDYDRPGGSFGDRFQRSLPGPGLQGRGYGASAQEGDRGSFEVEGDEPVQPHGEDHSLRSHQHFLRRLREV